MLYMLIKHFGFIVDCPLAVEQPDRKSTLVRNESISLTIRHVTCHQKSKVRRIFEVFFHPIIIRSCIFELSSQIFKKESVTNYRLQQPLVYAYVNLTKRIPLEVFLNDYFLVLCLLLSQDIPLPNRFQIGVSDIILP